MISCKLCEFFTNTFFVEHLLTAGSETSVPLSIFNKVASLMVWRPVTLLERDPSTGFSLWVLQLFLECFFTEYLLETTSNMAFFIVFSENCSLKQFIWWNNGILEEGIHKPVQSCAVMEIMRKLHLPSGYYRLISKKKKVIYSMNFHRL